MENVYWICLVLGLVIPFFTIFLHAFDGFIDFLSFDLLHLEFPNFSLDLLPLSVNALSMFALLFGGCGILLSPSHPLVLVNVIGGVVGYIGAVVVQSLISKLKRVKNFADEKSSMTARNGVVVNAIPVGDYGSVRLSIAGSSSICYPATSEDGLAIEQDTEVEIVEMKDNSVVVRKKSDLVGKYI